MEPYKLMFTNDTPHSRVMDKDKTITNRPLSDMESDGVYFPENDSGLPSVEWYSQNSEQSDSVESS